MKLIKRFRQAKPGECSILTPAERSRLVGVYFTLGLACGIGVAELLPASTSPVIAASAPRAVAAPLLKIGEHLCKAHEGLANITRLSREHYRFDCRVDAVFPRVQIKGLP